MSSSFTHLHCHTQYSLLDGAAKIKELIQRNKKHGMGAIAITDHGNMFGVPHFVTAAEKEGVKPIVGCEFYIADDMHDKRNKKRYHQLLLAKNADGYRNLMKLCSLGFTEGYYYKPRIDRRIIAQYANGLIATTCCLGAEVPQMILHHGEKEAEKIFLAWKEIFGEDYYIELQRHGLPEQIECNAILQRWSNKYNVPMIATNDVHYIDQADSQAQDILLCIQTGKDYNDPNRMRFANDQFYLKTPQEMSDLFIDIPSAIENTQAIVDKVEPIQLMRDVLMPNFPLPHPFQDQSAYLRHLVESGAKKRYGHLTTPIMQRINEELGVIQSMKFSGYFLIVQDLINSARELNVSVGPGRGSVSGSIVAYALGITEIDPIRYDLYFERFLNPERISMPDIDIDFDDEGRQRVIDYVVTKYGKQQVAQIITFGTLGAKSAIRDVARVLGLPLDRANHLAKLVPEKIGTSLEQAFAGVPELRNYYGEEASEEGKVLRMAEKLEGVTRHAGIHAAGIIIAPDDLTNHIPVKTDKNASLLVTQYDGSIVESVGMLKMDFLGLKTLSILKDAVSLIEKNHGIKINWEELPLDDSQTYGLYQSGDTIGTFQFESDGMRQYLTQLRPTTIEDLIAMNALYRPGPMQFIPNFIARKHGEEKVEYPHPILEPILRNTYGIMVYQEQVMQTARVVAGYTLGSADLLRRAMGKKKADVMAQQKKKFIAGANETLGIAQEQAQEIFAIMERFAEYGFPRAHAVAYAVVAYRTGYLKANYPVEYMASLLSHNERDLTKVALFIEEARRMGIEVLGPNINQSDVAFTGNKRGQISFGLAGIKGIGQGVAETIVKERNTKGVYKDIYDFCRRSSHKKMTSKVRERLALSGAFDCLKQFHRRQYMHGEKGESLFIEKIAKHAEKEVAHQTKMATSLFADQMSLLIQEPYPDPPLIEPYEPLEQLAIEKEMIGFYLSGHPLDPYRLLLHSYGNTDTQRLYSMKERKVALPVIVASCQKRETQSGKHFITMVLEDYRGSIDFALFGKDYTQWSPLIQPGSALLIQGKITPRYGKKDMWELKPSQIDKLDNLLYRIQKIHLTLPASAIGKKEVDELVALTQKEKGRAKLLITLFDKEKKIHTQTCAQVIRTHPGQAWIQWIQKIPHAHCQVE